MAILDKPLRKVSTRLIRRFGTTVTLIRKAAPVYNIQTGTATESATNYQVKAIVQDYNAKEMQDGLVKVGDRRVLFASAELPFEPQPSDQVVLEGITHNVITIQQFYSGDQSAVFSCQLRK